MENLSQEVECDVSLSEHLSDNLDYADEEGLTGDDCPPFEGLFEFCSISAGGSIGKRQCVIQEALT